MARQISALKGENRLLEAELKLASKGTTYIILDMRTISDSAPMRISLKNRGTVLREFHVHRIRYGRAKGLPIEPIPLTKKTAFFPPKRKEIRPLKPEDKADTTSPPDVLELNDMPPNYTLSFGKELSISITGKPKGFISRFIHRIRSLLTHLRYSLTMVWNYLWKKEFAIIQMMMDHEDAQAFYWSLDEGMSIVVIEGPPFDLV